MSTDGYQTTSAGKINATYDNNHIVEKLVDLEPMCDETKLPVLKTIKMFFVKKAELDQYTEIDLLFDVEKTVLDCQRKLLEWSTSSHGGLQQQFDDLSYERNELWLAKTHPAESIKNPDKRNPIEYPPVAYSGFKNPYDTDSDIVTKIDSNKYTGEEVKLLLEQVSQVVFELTGEEQRIAQLKYVKDYNNVTLKLTQVKDLADKLPAYREYLKANHKKHIEFLKQEKQLEQLKREISDLSASVKL